MGCLPDLRPDRLLGARAARHAALHPGLRRRRRVGRRGAAGGRAQPERSPAASGQSGRRPACRPATSLATVVLLILTTTLSDAAFLSWGWRVAFWLSAVIVARRLLHPHQGHATRRSSSRRRRKRSSIKADVVRRLRGAQALPARRAARRWACVSARTSCTTWWSPSRSPTSRWSSTRTPRRSSGGC